ncbi:MAG: holo-ACP synthase [Acidimicrobiales bacterium]|nr:holo-ACP synthase [Acidimicrobiales bacterium]
MINDEFPTAPNSVEGYQVGIDAVDCMKFRDSLKRTPRMLNRLFSESELLECAESPRRHLRLAARFGAKEAVWKLLGVGLGGVDFKDVEVKSEKSGKPSVFLHGRALKLADAKGMHDISISLTHTNSVAIAIAIAKKNNDGKDSA